MQFNTLTLTLQNFIAAFSGGYARLQGSANSLLGILVGIEVVLLGLWTALGGGDNVVGIFKKILHIGAWVWLVQSYPGLCKAFMESLVQAGLTAGGGGDVSLLMDPSRLAGYGLDATEPLTQKLADLGMTDLSDLLVFGFAYLAIMACFLIMAIHVFMAVLEYYLFAALVGIFLPFGLLAPTKFLAEKAVGAVVSASVKLMVLAFLLSVVDPVLSQIHFQGPEITFNELWSVFLTVCALMLLCWKAPSLAAALLGGSPHLGAGDVLQAVSTPIAAGMAAGALAARAGAGATSAAGAAASGVSGAAGRGSRIPAASGGGGASATAAPGSSGSSGGSGGDKAPSGTVGNDGGGEPTATSGSAAGGQPGASASLVQSAMGKTASTSPPAGGSDSGVSAAASRSDNSSSAESAARAAGSGASGPRSPGATSPSLSTSTITGPSTAAAAPASIGASTTSPTQGGGSSSSPPPTGSRTA